MSLAVPYGSLADPTGSSTLVAAVRWIEAAALGTIATSVALIAVAAIGLMMLTGRVPVRRGATVLLGCFVLFGAPVIAAGIRQVAGNGRSSKMDVATSLPLPAPSPAPKTPPSSYDPYAGAAVPVR